MAAFKEAVGWGLLLMTLFVVNMMTLGLWTYSWSLDEAEFAAEGIFDIQRNK